MVVTDSAIAIAQMGCSRTVAANGMPMPLDRNARATFCRV